ncbi:MAG: hypothetical protein Edafosvirus19_6 [Edafosvirus sp.]|uniref:Uncharacterized protein n=1 Tax=Edafosvirus sp. TaxID=2487765 RepID=A0A3G4ZYU3_9VIRU|nr:MAG: hypothetical protein Edafosvirus19_6 [Edafosvirus sp.]
MNFESKAISLDIKENYRYKITVNLFANEKLIDSYTDKITIHELLSTINQFIKLCHKYEIMDIIYAQFQKSFDNSDVGIIATCNQIDNLQKIKLLYEEMNKEMNKEINKEMNNKIFGVKTRTSKILYLSDCHMFVDSILWCYNMESFVQIHKEANDYIKRNVSEWIKKTNCVKYFGLGGEALYFSQENEFKNVTVVTNCKGIYELNLYNTTRLNKLVDNKLVDYQKLTNLNGDRETMLLINISRNGLGHLANIINNFSEIIYIGCCTDIIKKDMEILSKKYKVINYQIIQTYPPPTKYMSYIIQMKLKVEII